MLRELFGLAVVPGFIVALLVLAVYLTRLLIKPGGGEYKLERYEAGNLPKGEARVPIGFQYFGFLIMFLALEPTLIIMYTVLVKPSLNSILTYIFMLVLLAPALAYAYIVSSRTREWEW